MKTGLLHLQSCILKIIAAYGSIWLCIFILINVYFLAEYKNFWNWSPTFLQLQFQTNLPLNVFLRFRIFFFYYSKDKILRSVYQTGFWTFEYQLNSILKSRLYVQTQKIYGIVFFCNFVVKNLHFAKRFNLPNTQHKQNNKKKKNHRSINFDILSFNLHVHLLVFL